MDKYKNAKIYKLVDVDYKMCYIGSTIENLSKRMRKHRYDYTRCQVDNDFKKCCPKSVTLFENYGLENVKIELIENFPCNSKEELRQREGYHIQNTDCINRCLAGRDKITYNRQRYQKKKESILQQYKEYREKHKEEIRERRKQLYTCICGSISTFDHKARHERTKKHIDFINNQK